MPCVGFVVETSEPCRGLTSLHHPKREPESEEIPSGAIGTTPISLTSIVGLAKVPLIFLWRQKVWLEQKGEVDDGQNTAGSDPL
jgi:hypothetical protein